MTALAEKKCSACRGDAPQVSQEEARRLMAEIPDWHLVRDGASGENKLTRAFSFKNFVDALTFANQVGELAESEGHHPALLVEWGKLTVSWWTHKIGGLHENDFIMAARTDALSKAGD